MYPPLQRYCSSHIIGSESSPPLIPLAIHTVNVFPNHSQVLVSGSLESSLWHQVFLSTEPSDWSISQHRESLTSDPAGRLRVPWPLVRLPPARPVTESVRRWRWRDGTTPSGVWCVRGEVWIQTDSCTEGPAAARGRGSHRPSRTTSSPRR